jgi:hypothetical protein
MSATIYYLPTKPKQDVTRDQLLDHGHALLHQGWTDAALDNWLDRVEAWETQTSETRSAK